MTMTQRTEEALEAIVKLERTMNKIYETLTLLTEAIKNLPTNYISTPKPLDFYYSPSVTPGK